MTRRSYAWVLAGWLGVTLLPVVAAANPITTWTYGGSDLLYVEAAPAGGALSDAILAPPSWQPYSPPPTVGSSPLPNGIKLFGTGDADSVFQLTGATYVPSPVTDPDYRGNQLVISGTGTLDGAAWAHPGDHIRTTFGLGFDFSGGTLDIYQVQTGFLLLDGGSNYLIGVGSGTSCAYSPGGYGVGFAFEDRFGVNYQSAESMLWTVTIAYDWTDMSPEDTLTFSIPQNSIDIQAVTPEPATVAMLSLGAVGLVGRGVRRKR